MRKKLTYISLFSSAGIGCYGFKQEGFECIATNEIIKKRLDIQKNNKKCKFETGYIHGDIREHYVKEKIYDEINKWKKAHIDRVDVVIATPPCQGMSVANHKKSNSDLYRNSLVNESVEIIKKINPKIFIFENVRSFWRTSCINKAGEKVQIGEMISDELSSNYIFHNEIINFKNYGSNSSRTRTLVIGIDKYYSENIHPLDFFPDYKKEKTLYQVIGKMKKLKWGEFDKNDFFHNFRVYPKHMRMWIKNLKEGESAFDNDKNKNKPHKIIDEKLVIHRSKNSDKYKRQFFNKVAPCIHTRNDQLASQNTIHPIDDRVFSIRELMKIMTIPDSFIWINKNFKELNNLSKKEKIELYKKEEINIRKSIGEAVPTNIFRQIAIKIKKIFNKKEFNKKEILNEIKLNNLENFHNLKKYIIDSQKKINYWTLSRIIELSNSKREINSGYYTQRFVIYEIFKYLPNFKKKEITIIEPSVGAGNFLPFIFKKYADIKKVNLIVVDIDENIVDLLKIIYKKENVPSNFNITFLKKNFLDIEDMKVDLIVGNPPFTKILKKKYEKYMLNNFNKKATNLSELILEKSILMSDYVSLIMPKNLLNTPEYKDTRLFLEKYGIKTIIDFKEKGFQGVLVETINLIIDTKNLINSIEIVSNLDNIRIMQKKDYIFDKNLPYWVIYRNDFFDKIFKKMEFNIFNVFRDRQITNSNTFSKKKRISDVRVIKSGNIGNNGEIINDIKKGNSYIDVKKLINLSVKKYLENSEVYMTPNMSYNPRIVKKNKGYVVNGSVALLIPKFDFDFSKNQINYISSDEFRNFYKIARNYQTRSLNIDSASCYWFGMNKEL